MDKKKATDAWNFDLGPFQVLKIIHIPDIALSGHDTINQAWIAPIYCICFLNVESSVFLAPPANMGAVVQISRRPCGLPG